ncbi:MAG: hypothetical protein V3V14_04885 [Saprospiraceae bacterium]
MKLTYITFILILFASIGTAQTKQIKPRTDFDKRENFDATYKLFPTQNIWTFIKLNTRNGKMWQVHFTIAEKGAAGEIVLNSLPLVRKNEEIDNRFTLYPTENIYNFILLDQVDGNVYQVQWSMKENHRGVLPIY